MTYAVKEIFYTLQSEGFHAGTPAVFIRFAGCNLWSGRDDARERAAAANRAKCPLWCDTDFVGGTKMSAQEIADAAAKTGCDVAQLPLIVLTGGEPLLQVDDALTYLLHLTFPFAIIAVETNGTVTPRTAGIDWVCVSPKVDLDKLRLTRGHELKVVWPAYDPAAYRSIWGRFHHRYVSAEATTSSVGNSLISQTNLLSASEWVMRNPGWNLTVQSHKIIGIR